MAVDEEIGLGPISAAAFTSLQAARTSRRRVQARSPLWQLPPSRLSRTRTRLVPLSPLRQAASVGSSGSALSSTTPLTSARRLTLSVAGFFDTMMARASMPLPVKMSLLVTSRSTSPL